MLNEKSISKKQCSVDCICLPALALMVVGALRDAVCWPGVAVPEPEFEVSRPEVEGEIEGKPTL